MLPQAVGLLMFMLYRFFGTINIQGRELYFHDLVKCTFDIILHSDTYKPISFKHGMVLDTTKLHFDAKLNDLDLHSKSQDWEKARAYAIILL